MKYKTLGKTGYNISCVMFGGVILMNESAEDAAEYVAYAIEKGVNYFDIAPSYGNTEERLGPVCLNTGNKSISRAKTTGAARRIKKELLNSLKVLQTDHLTSIRSLYVNAGRCG